MVFSITEEDEQCSYSILQNSQDDFLTQEPRGEKEKQSVPQPTQGDENRLQRHHASSIQPLEVKNFSCRDFY